MDLYAEATLAVLEAVSSPMYISVFADAAVLVAQLIGVTAILYGMYLTLRNGATRVFSLVMGQTRRDLRDAAENDGLPAA